MDDWFMGLAPENLLAENNLVKTVTLIRWNWEGRCSASSITGCWFSRWCCLPSQVMVGLTLLGGNESSIWNIIYIQFVWCDYLCWQEPRTCASPRIQAGRQRILSEASGFELMLFETNFPVPCYVSEPPLALAVTVFSRGLSVLTAGPAGCPKARSSSRQYPDPTERGLCSQPRMLMGLSTALGVLPLASFFCCLAMNTVQEWIRSRKPSVVEHLGFSEWSNSCCLKYIFSKQYHSLPNEFPFTGNSSILPQTSLFSSSC